MMIRQFLFLDSFVYFSIFSFKCLFLKYIKKSCKENCISFRFALICDSIIINDYSIIFYYILNRIKNDTTILIRFIF